MDKIKLTEDLFVYESIEEEAEKISRPSFTYWQDAFRRFKANKVVVGAFILLLIMVFLAIFVPIFSRYNYYQQDYNCINKWPFWEHFFGTDDLGRDLFVRCWEGARVSLFIGIMAAFINGGIGIIYGGLSGFLGGTIDMIMMRFVEIIISIPQLLWIILLILIMKPGIWPIIIAISATGWVQTARIFRGQVLQIRETEYVMASKIFRASNLWIIYKHLLPNAISPILINLTFIIPGAIFAEAFLSYIGLGLPLPMASWGNLAAGGASVIFIYPYQLFFPALLISITMLSFNIIGDGLRDAFDPKFRI